MAKKKKEKKEKNKKKAAKLQAKADKAEAAKAEKSAKKEKKLDKKAAKDGDAEKATSADATDKKGEKKPPVDVKKVRKQLQETAQQYVSPFSDDPDEGQFGFGDDQAADLADLEHMLNVEVDEDFFAEPRYFHTLNRVINVLGIQLNDDGKEDTSGKSVLERNPAYQNLQKQAGVVESAIEHMSRVYCNALNRSVIQVGRIAREFDDAIGKVESLRRQLRVIQETIGARSRANANQQLAATKQGGNKKGKPEAQKEVVVAATPATHMSLRELWMKKLEGEALLTLIAKINIVRDAPGRFDNLTTGDHKNCRIGAATRCLTEALDTMFSDDVSQVDALSQILENLMTRKTTAGVILWETLEDILYLRTSNGPVLQFEVNTPPQQDQNKKQKQPNVPHPRALQKAASFGGDSQAKGQDKGATDQTLVPKGTRRIFNPFHKNHVLLCVKDTGDTDDVSIDSNAGEPDDDDDDDNDDLDDVEETKVESETPTIKRATSDISADTDAPEEENVTEGKKKHSRKMMIPRSVVESEVYLVGDELRCFDFESEALSKVGVQKRYIPRYTDPVLSLRIVVESLVKIGQLQLAESILLKNIEKEIKNIIQREQARTFYRLDRRKPSETMRSAGKNAAELKDFRRHFSAILSSFGCIMMRLSHLAQISRNKICADEELAASIREPTTFLRPVLDKAHNLMQSEIKDFLRACLQEHLSKGKAAEAPTTESETNKIKIFSFGVLEGNEEEQKKTDGVDKDKKQEAKQESEQENPEEEENEATADVTSSFKEMPIGTFVSSVLFPMTNTTPQVQHALVFRRSIDQFTNINKALKEELALATGETALTAFERRKFTEKELAIQFLDKAIDDSVLPLLQTQGFSGVLVTSEMADAFEPPVEANVYARADKIQPLDVAMVAACEGMLETTEPLFMAVHRLPSGGEFYVTLVQLLEFLLTTFNSYAEKNVVKICDETTSEELLEGYGDDKGKLSAALGQRKAFRMLLKAYDFDLDLIEDADMGVGAADVNGAGDENASPEKASKPLGGDDELPSSNIERFEAIMKQEMEHLSEYLDFLPFHQESLDYDLIAESELKGATCLAHSFLKVSSILEGHLKVRGSRGGNRLLEDTEELHDRIKTLKQMGMTLAKFCHVEVLLQVIRKMAPICQSTALCAKDAVRIPTAANNVVEYISGTMDYLREATSNAMAAYVFSNVGQYIPDCLMSTVRVIATGEGIIERAPLTMHGIESLDRSAAVLYKDLKAAIGFQSQFFDIEVTAVAFEKAATFTALMEMSIEELAEYYTTHSGKDFSDDDFELMFKMDGPRRVGDDKQFKKLKNVIKKRRREKEEKKEAGQATPA